MILNCNDIGPGPVMVLLHGFPLDNTMWEYQKGAIGSKYRILAFDLRGHGQSLAPDGVYSMDAMADDVIESLDALKITEPFVLGGLSMGGYVALSIVARFPQRLRGLILLDSRATADSPEAAGTREGLAQAVEQTSTVEPVVQAMLPKLFSPITRTRRPELISQVSEQMRRTPAQGIVGSLRGLATRPDRTAALSQIRVPTLVVCGADDAITPPAEMRSMADAIPRSRYLEVPDAGHLSPLENPTPVNDAILALLWSLEKA